MFVCGKPPLDIRALSYAPYWSLRS